MLISHQVMGSEGHTGDAGLPRSRADPEGAPPLASSALARWQNRPRCSTRLVVLGGLDALSSRSSISVPFVCPAAQ